MKRPIHAFFNHSGESTTGSLQSLQSQMQYLEKLTQLTKPVLPPNQTWQVVSFQEGILCIATDNYAAMSQLRYLQTHYIKQLQYIAEFRNLRSIKVIVEARPVPKTMPQIPPPALNDQTRQAILEAATLIHDRELSQALQRLASKK
ncbi:DciA family protein [Alkanindiges sp. WGS2144]|uniref:DciA family protein n=1 Tax=Alkanindiges sp. WGS2144 TaxID=3366808 RepID=UPI0037524FD1